MASSTYIHWNAYNCLLNRLNLTVSESSASEIYKQAVKHSSVWDYASQRNQVQREILLWFDWKTADKIVCS